MQLRSKNRVPYLTFGSLEESGLVTHGFSTRLGGVSEGHLASMNLGFLKGDDPEKVDENYRRMGGALGISPDQMVMSVLVHGTVVRRVTAADAGKGITRGSDFDGCDGLITDEPGLALVCRYADCIPLFFLDPVKRAIGLSHSGWRGTAGRMARSTIEAMTKAFGTDPADLIACIGPGICGSCFEVGPEVAEEFARNFEDCDAFIRRKYEDKYLVDLPAFNRIAMIEAGVLPERIEAAELCTCCNPDLLFSHRATGGKRGDMAGFLMLGGPAAERRL